MNWPKIYQATTETNHTKIFACLQQNGYQPKLNCKLETMSEYKKYLQVLRLQLSTSENIHKLLEMMDINEDIDIKEQSKDYAVEDLQKFYNMMFIDKILNSIKQTVLPIHQVETQLNAAIKRHDLNISDPSFNKTLYSSTTYYFCIGCEDVSFSHTLCAADFY